MVGYRQLTREAEQVLKRAKRVYLLHPLPEVRSFVDTQCGSVIDLTELYEEGSERAESYEEMAQQVVEGAEEAVEPVVFAVYGHPTVGVAPSSLIQKKAKGTDLIVEILPGISALDCLYTDLGFDPFTRGLQVFEATDLIVYDINLDPATPTFVLQVGLTGTRLYDTRTSTSKRLLPLKDHILQFYPPDHEVIFARTPTIPFADAQQLSVPISEFETVATDIDSTHTLVIPPVKKRHVENSDFAEKIYTQEFLEQITE